MFPPEQRQGRLGRIKAVGVVIQQGPVQVGENDHRRVPQV